MSIEREKSEIAAKKTLQKLHERLLDLNLFDTVVQLYAMGKLSQHQHQKLSHDGDTEISRTRYLLAEVIPTPSGYYEGLQCLMQALKKSNQFSIATQLEKVYEDEISPSVQLSDAVEAEQDVRHEPLPIESSGSITSRDIPSFSVEFRPRSVQVGRESKLTIFKPDTTPSYQRPQLQSRVYTMPQGSDEGRSGGIFMEKDNPKSLSLRRISPGDLPVMKLIMVGDSFAGKTSLFHRWSRDQFIIDQAPTVGADVFATEVEYHGIWYRIYLWDTAGSERFKSIAKTYYRDAVGAFVVYDVASEKSMEHCRLWKEEVDNAVQLMNGDPIPVILISNKIDCGKRDGYQFSREHKFAGYFETSAKTGKGISEAMHYMVKKVHNLSLANKEPVGRTLTRNRNSIMLPYAITDFKDTENSICIKKKCCN